MPGTPSELPFDFTTAASSPVPLASDWMTVIEDEGVKTLDADPIIDPNNQIGSDRIPIRRNSRANILRLRMKYNSSVLQIASLVSPIVKVFGAYAEDGPWQILENRAGNLNAELTMDPGPSGDPGSDIVDDVTGPTYKYTHPSRDQNAWDCEGYDYVLVGVERAYVPGSGQTDTVVTVEARMTTF